MLHVDGRYGGYLLLFCREFYNGCSMVRSISTVLRINPHKWMFTTFDCPLFCKGCFLLIKLLRSFLGISENQNKGKSNWLRDWVSFGRRFRALNCGVVIDHTDRRTPGQTKESYTDCIGLWKWFKKRLILKSLHQLYMRGLFSGISCRITWNQIND